MRHGPNYRLPAGVDVDMLDRDLLLALAPVSVQGLEQGSIGAAECVRLGEGLAAPNEYAQKADHCSARVLRDACHSHDVVFTRIRKMPRSRLVGA